jgi:hypothetical protein
MRLAYRDSDERHVQIAGVANEFTFKASADIPTTNPCDAAYSEVDSGAQDKTLSFDGSLTNPTLDFAIDGALRVNLKGVTNQSCRIKYELFLWDKTVQVNGQAVGGWKSAEAFIDGLRAEVPHRFSSHIEFNSDSANINALFSKEDIDALDATDRFKWTDSAGNEQNSLRSKVVARVVGSSTQGVTATLDVLPSKEFNIKVVDAGLASSCADNFLELTQVSARDNTYREQILEHTIPSPGANAQASSFIVTGKKVSQAISSCELVTQAYWFDNTKNNWEQIRNDEDGTTVMHLEPNNMYIEWKPTQHDF